MRKITRQGERVKDIFFFDIILIFSFIITNLIKPILDIKII